MKNKPHRPSTKFICTVCIILSILSTTWNACRSVALWASLMPDETFICDGIAMTAEDGTVYSLKHSHLPWLTVSAPKRYRRIGTAYGNIEGQDIIEPVYRVYDFDSQHYMLRVGNTYGNLMPQYNFYRVDFEPPEVTPEVVDAVGFYKQDRYTISFDHSIVERLFEIQERTPVARERFYREEEREDRIHYIHPEYLDNIYLYDYDQEFPLFSGMRFVRTWGDKYYLEDEYLYEVTREEMEEILSDITAAGKRVRYPSQLKKPE